MNILFCLDNTFSRKDGGIAAVSLSLRDGFVQNGHQCFFVSAIKDCDDEEGNQTYLPNPTVETKNKENREWYRKYVIENKIEIIINQNGSTPKSLWPVLWIEDIKILKFTVYHSDFTSLWSCHNKYLTENMLICSFHLNSTIDYIWNFLFKIKYRKYLRRQYELSDKLIFLTEKYYAGFGWFSGICKNKKFGAIYNPVDERFLTGGTIEEKEKEVLFVGRISFEKGIDYLINVWKKLYTIHPDWKLTIVGEGPEKKNLESYVIRNGVKNLKFVGYSDPLEYYRRASIVCLTSRTEGFGVVLIEGMASYCIPLAFNSYACASEIIDNGINGILVQPFDTADYAKKLSMLMDDKELRVQLAQAAIIKSKEFTLDRVIKKWLELIAG